MSKRIPVQSIMHPGLECAPADLSVAEVVALMHQHRIGAMIIGTPAEMVGIFSERDLLNKVVGPGLDIHATPVKTVMTASLLTLPGEADINQALKLMESHNIRHLPIVDAAGSGIGMLGMRDLMKTMVQHLERENEALSQLDRLKDEFLANTSHELRTPLNGIIGIAESMLDGATGELSASQLYNLSLVVASGRRLANLVNDILDFSKLKHRTLELNLRPVSLRSLADVVLTVLMHLTHNKPLNLHNAIPTEMVAVLADENRLQQILYNLVGNAIKFTDLGLIEISARQVGAQVHVSVCDTGRGIPQDQITRIFESFEQGEGVIEREFGGTGIGLAITRQLVELHGGKIWVESHPGEGSVFTFGLPASVDVAEPLYQPMANEELSQLQFYHDEAPLFAESDGVPAEGARGDGFRILIVDDEPINGQVLANLLSLEHYQIFQARDGNEALQALDSDTRFDLVLLDIMMPRMSGYEVCRQIRQRYPATELPVVMLTAKNQVSDLVEGFQMGANDYLTKPFSKNELRARIKTHIELAKINMAYSRFVPREFLGYLGHESIVQVRLGDQVQKQMTIFFTDIRSFTTLSETMSPKENFDFLNSYLSRVSPVIRQNRGFIDKYIGDAIMALFPESPADAIEAALEMLDVVYAYNPSRIARGFEPIEIGFGVHTGSLMLGTIGENERMEGTVISDAVNLASRMEGLTKIYGAAIILSEQVLAHLPEPEKYPLRPLGQVRVKGKNKSVRIFELIDRRDTPGNRLKRATSERFAQGLEAYEQALYDVALLAFGEVKAANPEDLAAELYLDFCQQAQAFGQEHGPSKLYSDIKGH